MLKDIKYTVNSETIATDVFRKMLLSSQFQKSFNKYKLLLGYKIKCFIFYFITFVSLIIISRLLLLLLLYYYCYYYKKKLSFV